MIAMHGSSRLLLLLLCTDEVLLLKLLARKQGQL